MLSKLKLTVQKNKDYRRSFKNQYTKKHREPNSDSDSDSDTDLNQLVSTFSNIDISSNSSNINKIKMAANYSEVRLFLDIIPNFSGEPCELNNFISACDEAVTQYAADQTVSKLIFRGIIGKLKAKALILVSSRAELTTWEQIKSILKQTFSDQRSFNCLLQELHNMRPQPRENSYSFGVRCQYLRSLICSSINNDSTLSNANKLAQIENIEKLILITFQKYLPSQIQLAVRLKNPSCLEDAMQYLIEEENFISIVNDGKSKQFPNSSVQSNHGFYNVPKPNFQAPIYNRINSQQPQTSTQNRFPNQSLNITPRNQPPPRYFTNKQVFGKPTPPVNVWKPQNTMQPKPTPMSGVSIQATPKQHGNFQQLRTTPMSGISRPVNQRQNYFQPQSRPTFISEEIYNIDETPPDFEDDNMLQLQNDNTDQDDFNQPTEEILYPYAQNNDIDECEINPNLNNSQANQEVSEFADLSNFQEISFPQNPP